MAYPRDRSTPKETGKRKALWAEALDLAQRAAESGDAELAKEAGAVAAVVDSWKGELPEAAEVAAQIARLDAVKRRLARRPPRK